MKKIYFLTIMFGLIVFTACKKDYDCSAVDETGATTMFKCENCSSSAKDDYEALIVAKGYTSASCAK